MTSPTRPYPWLGVGAGDYCSTECASHRCTRPCGRVTEHPADEADHICDDCASAIAGWF